MKKIFILLSFIGVLFLTSCGVTTVTTDNALAMYSEKLDNLSSYKLNATMEVNKGETKVQYDVVVLYSKPNQYKITLTTKENNNVQIIIKNTEGVYVLTPALNKSFKFTSDWPLNSFHSYLPESSLKEIVNDNNRIIKATDDSFTMESKVCNKTNSKLNSQKLTIDKNLKPTSIIVYNANMIVEIKVTITLFEENKSIDANEFDVEKSLKTAILSLGEGTVGKVIELSLPTQAIQNETLKSEIVKETSVLRNYGGDINYTIYMEVVETSVISDTIKQYDELVLLEQGIGAATTKSLTWFNGNVMCSIYSEDISLEEMILIADSIW